LWAESVALNEEDVSLSLAEYPDEIKTQVFQNFRTNWAKAQTPWEKAHSFRTILFDYQQLTKRPLRGADDAWPLWDFACTLCEITELKAMSGKNMIGIV